MANYLEPEDSPFHSIPILAQYYSNINSRLLPESSSHTRALVVFLPSFQQEWALRLHGTDRSGSTITVTQGERQLWFDDPDEIPISQHSLEITPDLAVAFTDALGKALLTVANVNQGSRGLDGTTYHFSAMHSQKGWLSGKTWSPDPATVAGRLVDLVERLRSYVEGDRARDCSLDAIVSGLRNFEAVPQYHCDDKALASLWQNTQALLDRYSAGVVSANEIIQHLGDACQASRLPAPSAMLRLIDMLPQEIQERIRRG
jgi:hypothetical protein